MTYESFNFLHQAWFTISKIPFFDPSLDSGFLHSNSSKINFENLITILIQKKFLFRLENVTILTLYRKTSCFDRFNRKVERNISFHKE